MAAAGAQQDRARPYILWVIALGAALLAAVAVAAIRSFDAARWLAPSTLLLIAALAGGSWIVLHNVLTFDWLGQRVALAPDEALVFLALVTLPPPLVVAFALPPMALFQLRTRRGALRGGFNVANLVVSTTVGTACYLLLLGAGAHPLVAAGLALVPYTVTTHALVSGVFAARESVPPWRVFRERFLWRWVPNLAIGAGFALALLGLFTLHPLAMLGLAPFVWLAREHALLAARRDREARSHGVLSAMHAALAGESREEVVVESAVAAAGELLRAGRVELVVERAGSRSLSRDFAGGPRPGVPPIRESVLRRGGALFAHLDAYPPASTRERFDETDRNVLRVVATATASALDHAEALRRLDEAQQERLDDLARRSELERLKALDELKTRFLNMAAHDLGSPLTAASLRVGLLRRAARGRLTEEDHRSLDVVERNLRRLSALVGDLLEAARLQAQRMDIRPEPSDLRDLAAEAIESFADAAEAAGVRVEARLAPAPAAIDAKRVTQVIYNLLSNAIKFTPAGGTVTIASSVSSGEAVVLVRDTGRGIAADDLQRLFQPFSQVHDDARAYRGTGLGLYISRGIAELHGGSLVCESAGLGQGAAFTLRIPVARAHPVAPQPIAI